MEKIMVWLFGPVAVMVEPDHDPLTNKDWRKSRARLWVFFASFFLCFFVCYGSYRLPTLYREQLEESYAATQSAFATQLYQPLSTPTVTYGPD